MGMDDLWIDVKALPDDGYGFFQLLTLGSMYGYVLMYASNLISDGSELLLLVPELAGLVGSVVLPVLGAVPDGCIVLFSGMGENAQAELSVGVGALAGSTIMLLSVPWFLSIVGGRVDYDAHNKPRYKAPKLADPSHISLFTSGITIGPIVNKSSIFMLVTSLSYLILQIPDLFYMDTTIEEQAAAENSWSFIGLLLCTFFFISYLYYQYQMKDNKDDIQEISRDAYIIKAIENKSITLLGVMASQFKSNSNDAEGRLSSLSSKNVTSYQNISSNDKQYSISQDAIDQLQTLVKPFFKKYDTDKNGHIDQNELNVVIHDLGENLSSAELAVLFDTMDESNSDRVTLPQFTKGIAQYIDNNQNLIEKHVNKTSGASGGPIVVIDKRDADTGSEGGDDQDEEEEEEAPEDLKDLSPEEQQRRIKNRSFNMMGLGTLLIVLFSDPMVAVMSELGVRTGISGFYIAFVLAPLASNASEVIASYNYALKKTPKSIAISLSALLGAAIMNNTFCLAIFMLLIYTQDLAWNFFAETASILFVQVCMFFMSWKSKHSVYDGIMILALYPISLLLVVLIESYGWN